MKRVVKYMLILAVGFLVLGCGFTIAGAALGGRIEQSSFLQSLQNRLLDGDFHLWTSRHAEKEFIDMGEDQLVQEDSIDAGGKEYEVDALNNLEIDLKADELIMEEYQGKNIRISTKDMNEDDIEVSVGDELVKIEGARKLRGGEVKVSYPKDMKFDNLKINVDAGEVSLKDPIQSDKLEITIGAGELSASEQITVKETVIDVGAGAVELDKIETSYLSGNCGVGAMELTLTGKEKDYNYYLECGLGEIEIGDQYYSSIADQMEIDNGHKDNQIALSCGLGEIEVKFTKH